MQPRTRLPLGRQRGADRCVQRSERLRDARERLVRLPVAKHLERAARRERTLLTLLRLGR